MRTIAKISIHSREYLYLKLISWVRTLMTGHALLRLKKCCNGDSLYQKINLGANARLRLDP